VSDPAGEPTEGGPGPLVVGGGILGLAVARALGGRGGPVTVVEAEAALARHQSGRNSGVVHAGLYYPPGSLKATLCARGRLLLRDFCAEHAVPFLEIGKVVVATGPDELDRLAEVGRRANANGVPGLRRLDRAGLAGVEPHVRGVAALHSPATAITDFPAVCAALARQVESAGGRVLLGRRVTGIRETASGVRVDTTGGPLQADRVVVCAGLHSDQVALAAGGDPYPRIVPFRGEYLALVPERRSLVRGLVYPVPDPRYPFLGVHATPRVDGEVLLGPNAVLALAREGYRRRDVDLRDTAGLLRSTAIRGLARRHWRTGVHEMVGSVLRPVFVHRARALLPELRLRDVVRAESGVRAQAVAADGALVDDFLVQSSGRVTLVRNAPSPAATSSLAIAEHLLERVVAGS
jgi:L-2-hydroxyglutarate oxidase LhgO